YSLLTAGQGIPVGRAPTKTGTEITASAPLTTEWAETTRSCSPFAPRGTVIVTWKVAVCWSTGPDGVPGGAAGCTWATTGATEVDCVAGAAYSNRPEMRRQDCAQRDSGPDRVLRSPGQRDRIRGELLQLRERGSPHTVLSTRDWC